MRRLLTFAYAGMLIAGTAAAAEPSYPKGQLPAGVAPTHYALELTILPDQPDFSGKAVIDVKLDQPTSVLWLHGREIKVSEVKVTDAKGASQAATWSEVPGSDGVAKVTVPKPVAGPTAQVAIVYTAAFNQIGRAHV